MILSHKKKSQYHLPSDFNQLSIVRNFCLFVAAKFFAIFKQVEFWCKCLLLRSRAANCCVQTSLNTI